MIRYTQHPQQFRNNIVYLIFRLFMAVLRQYILILYHIPIFWSHSYRTLCTRPTEILWLIYVNFLKKIFEVKLIYYKRKKKYHLCIISDLNGREIFLNNYINNKIINVKINKLFDNIPCYQ